MESRNKWLMELAECDKVISNKEIDKLGWTANEVTEADENVSDDEVDEDLETERHRLNKILGLPADTYSLTRIQTKLQNDAKYGIKSGHTHMNMIKFSPLSRGLQGAAIAVAAFATTSQLKASCWTDTIIDDIIEDGDTWYCESYKNNKTTDRRLLTVLNLLPSLTIQKKNIVYMNIDDAVYTGLFRTDNPTEMHFVKAIRLFFNTHNACIITSPILNISIWREDKFFNAFDAQPRLDNLTPDNVNGSVKLMKIDNLDDVVYIILEKSNIDKENFVIYPISIKASVAIDPDDVDHINEPARRPSAYNIDKKYRAIVKSTFHINHSNVTSVLQGRGHLIISIAAIIYTKLINAKKWTTPIIDLIFNQSHIFIIDLARVLDKKFDDTFDIRIDDVFGNIYLGIYHCKIKLTTNIIPGQGKKGKINIEIGLREFFKDNHCGLLEIKKIYYAIWKDDNKYYYLDPFACDNEGYRVDKNDPDNQLKYKSASGCVIMNSSINELIEIILENTGNTDKDPFFIHGINVLYIKTNENSRETIVYREKNTNRRPVGVDKVVPIKDECIVEIDMTPKPRLDNEKNKNIHCQYPEIMENGDDYVSVKQQNSSMIINHPNENEELLKFYKIINSNRFIIHASTSCIDDKFLETSQGRQGLSMALSAIYFSKIKHPSKWQTDDLDKILYFGDKTHSEVVDWICHGSPEIKDDEDDEDDDEEDDDDEDDEDNKDEDNIEENEEKKDVKLMKKIPNYIDITMLPKKLKIDNNIVKFTIIKSLIEGNADPMVNLGEAFEQYFRKYNELIIENKNLSYIIWKQDGNYFTFNPYGGDEEGWRYYGCPASFVVTDKITELVDLFYGILEFNDKAFQLHFINIEKIGPNNKYKSPLSFDLSGVEFEKYQTVFLPLTDDDILALKPPANKTLKDNDEDDEEEDEDDDDDDDDEDEEDDDNEEDKKISDEPVKEEKEVDEILVDPLLNVEEQNHPDTPSKLNLFLLTANINLQDEIIDQQAKEAIEYEKLKYNHPPPYVLPQKKVLKMLLNAKKASKSISSLVSCFSIDSKLAIKTYLTQNNNDINAIITNDNITSTKLIKLPKKKYLISRISPIGFTPLRAINDIFIHDENDDILNIKKCQDKNLMIQNENLGFSNELTSFTNDDTTKPLIIPVGPIIRTPISVEIIKPCMKNNKKRQCKLSIEEKNNSKLEKIVCYTEDILFNMLFPMKSINNQNEQFKIVENNRGIDTTTIEGKNNSSILMNANRSSDENIDSQSLVENEDFISTNNDSIFIISANMKLENRSNKEEHHHKACYYAAILCILAKTVRNIHEFYASLLDQLMILANKYYDRTGSLRYKQIRNFRNINLLNINFNIIVKQIIYADPENFENDLFANKIKEYLSKYPSGILLFDNASYGFWLSNGCYYIFDPYPCDHEGHASNVGTGCVLKYCKLDDMIDKVSNYSGVDVTKPYRIYNLSIGHIEMINNDNKKTKFALKENNKTNDENVYDKEDYHDDGNDEDKSEDDSEEEQEILKSKSEESLIESTSWLDETNSKKSHVNLTPKPAYVALNNLQVSELEVAVVEDDITQAILTPFKSTKDKNIKNEYIRKKQYIRKFNKQSIILLPIDLCIISWSCIIDPSKWSENIIKAIYETSKDITFDCLLAAEDFTVDNMIDGMLTEFEMGNYNFKSVFAPLHIGKLYSHHGWNLSMSLRKIFDNSIYTGAILFCGNSHIGVMKKSSKLYAWWCIDDTKNIKIIMSDNMEDYLKILIKKININEEIEFKIRIITISYAKILDPNCSDIGGLHDEIMPSSSLPQIHQNENGPYDLKAVFAPTIPGLKPIFIFGTVALESFDVINEPNVKRCYFVGILSVMMKRDIMQSPMPSIIDKIIKLSEDLYRQFSQPKYHTEHIILNVNVMNRIFEFRDVASSLVLLNSNHEKNNFFSTVKKELKKHFNKYNDGVIHFSNCCYGFWYSQSTNCYYYLDPYRCNARGKRQLNNIGNSCLKIFSTLCQMVESMSKNKTKNTTGFFIHQIHVESINALTGRNFKEDFMWIYLDYHWSFSHQKLPSVLDKKLDNKNNKKRKKNDNICNNNLNDDKSKNKSTLYWNNYVIEIPQLIYSLWGTIGTYDERFDNRIGKNKTAICISIIAMQNLCHPSKWTSAILDSAVICGDCYYIESLKNKRHNFMDNEGFNLQSCFKIYPHIWTIKYLPQKCGILYDNNDKLSLAVTLKVALEESNNILLNCDDITIGIVKCEDGYYAVDPCWTGPPLFTRNHGAVYVLRCRNISALIYALIKMINTNLRLEFYITPIIFEYRKETCKSSNVKSMKKKIFMEPLDTKPGVARGPWTPVPGSVTAGNQDIYSEYRNHIELGIKHGNELENPVIPSPIPQLNDERTNNFIISTKWHKYSGQNQPRKSSSPNDDVNNYNDTKNTSSSTSFIDVCDDYPKTIDFINNKFTKSKFKQQNKASLSVPLDCLPPKKFILKENKKEFKKTIAEMSDDVYKNYQHQSTVKKKTTNEVDENLDEDVDEKLVEDVDDSP